MTKTDDTEQDIESYLDTAKPQQWWKRKIVWISALVLALLVIAAIVFSTRQERPDYITAEVEERSLDLSVTATGNLRPTNQVEVGSEVSGRIDSVLVDVNDLVSKRQILARINTDVIEDQVTQARANVNAAQASLAQAQATLQVDTAQLERLREVHRLSGGKVPSRTEMEQAQGNVRRSQAAVASARANISSAQAQLSSSQTNRERAVIRSPVAGVVLARQVEPGQTVAASFNTPTLFVLAEDLSVMQLRVDIDEADVGQVQPGQKGSFTVDAYPGRRFPATVERVDLASNNIALTAQEQQQTQQVVSYEARLIVANEESLLRPGMTATATIATESTDIALLLPNGALRFDPEAEDDESPSGGPFNGGRQFGLEQNDEATIGVGSRQTVHVLDKDGELRKIEVVTGQSDGRMTVVTSDELEAGMKVVIGERAAAQ